MDTLLSEFILLFTIIDPIGSVPVFIAVTAGVPKQYRTAVAIRSVVIAAGVLAFFIALGKPLLDAIGIDIEAFRIAGGVILFLFAIDMIFGQSKPEREMEEVDRAAALDKAVYPMAIPSIAGPGAILAVVVLTEEAGGGLVAHGRIGLLTLGVLIIMLFALLLATKIHAKIGDVGASLISRIMGLIVAAIAAQSVLQGIQTFFEINTTP